MADYNLSTKSLLHGLSDFWLHFFKETETLEYFYKGAEIQIGQAYLDLLALLLNNSVQDATVFNKEFFKLLTIKESELQYAQGVTPSADRYYYVLPDNVVQVPYLNNKVLFPTAALDKNTDYFMGDDGTNARLEFKVDPTNAYHELIVGSSIASIRVRSLFAGPEGGQIVVHFNDNGSSTITITRTDYYIQVDYGGPFTTNTHSANALVQAINSNTDVNQFILAEVVNAVINASPSGTGLPTALKLSDSNPLDNFAKRKVTEYYGGSFTCSLIQNWTAAGVRKGDTLRLKASRGIGKPTEMDIDVLQGNKLFVNINTPIPEDNETSVDFTVLRTPANHTSLNEPIANSGVVIASALGGGTIVAATREFTVGVATFAAYHRGDVINIPAGNNIGSYEIIDVVSSVTVVLSSLTLTDEAGLAWELYSVVNPALTGVSATTTISGTTQSEILTDYGGVFTDSVIGAVLKVVQLGVLRHYAIIGHDGAQTLTVRGESPVVAPDIWAIADSYTASTTLVMSPPVAWPTASTVVVNAKRLIDDQLVQLGTDYRFNEDTGILESLTVWSTSLSNTVTYDFRRAVVETTLPVQLGNLGSIFSGSPSTFNALDANFLPEHVGFAIKLTGSGLPSGPPFNPNPPFNSLGPTNDGVHYISKVINTTTVELTPAKKVAPTVEPNNGVLVWSLHMRGSAVTQSDSAVINEISFWAPDVLVDRFNLYNTFGYLINKYSRSSETYRNFIRGVFQLFMLGPTLERFESAVNILAGLPVIRDDNEILVNYLKGAVVDGPADGTLTSADNSFSSISYTFTSADINRQIFISSGSNNNKTFTIVGLINPNKVLLNTTPTTNTGVDWELRELDAPQTVVTNKREYTLLRAVPLKAKYTDPANFSVLKLKSFEVISSVFLVTDYIESPRWWDTVTIPAELWENELTNRRQSTSQLFENVINPADGGCVGDPGFYIGATSDGFVPPSDVLRLGIPDGILLGDPLYPASNDTFFESATGAFSAADLGNILKIPGLVPVDSFRIVNIVSGTKVQIENFIQVPLSTAGLDWEIRSGALALRHKAAFIILDKYLKQHLFTVSFDFSTLELVDLNILEDLRKLIFTAKPSYTYLILNPYALFEEAIQINEEFEYEALYYLAGTGGDIVTANENPLTITGSSWKVGQWFRPIEVQGTFATPTATITNVLGIPDPGYEHYITKFSIIKGPLFPDNITEDHTAFTSSGTPIQIAEVLRHTEYGPAGGAEIQNILGDFRLVSPTAVFHLGHLLAEIIITGSGMGNDGTYVIGVIHDEFTASISRAAATVPETGLTWELQITGDLQGQLGTTTGGVAFFRTMQTSAVMSDPSLAGYHLRRSLPSGVDNIPNNFEAYRLDSLDFISALNDTVWLLYKYLRVGPLDSEPAAVADITANHLNLTSGAIEFSPSMARRERRLLDVTTHLKNKFYVKFTSGPNSGVGIEITRHFSNQHVRLDTTITLADDPAAQFFVYQLQTYDVVPEVNSWEIIKEQVVINKNTIDLTATPPQDAAIIHYKAYGVREPIDPSIEIFDASLGDTLYSVGMLDPKPANGKPRTGRDTDFREEPLQITVI